MGPKEGMPRKLREELAGGVHHVWARGNDRMLIYRDDRDRELYLTMLALTVTGVGWKCLAYCLMDNHVHLLIETPEPNLGRGMQRLHGKYGREFNDRYDRSGHVFQGRFGSKPMRSELQFWTTLRYIVQNPVEAGLCRAARAWRWSSHRALLDGTTPPWLDAHGLLARLRAAAGGDPKRVYRDLIDG